MIFLGLNAVRDLSTQVPYLVQFQPLLDSLLSHASSEVLKIFDARQFRQVFQAKLNQEFFRSAVHHRTADRFFAALRDDQPLVEQSLDRRR